jgi:FecR protein
MVNLAKPIIIIIAVAVLLSGNKTALSQTPNLPEADVSHQGFRAQGGLVNFSEGTIECVCGSEKKSIRAGQELKDGDSIETGPDSRTEILLSPGTVLRLSAGTRVELMDSSAANLKLKLVRGSAIVEMALTDTISSSFQSEVIYAPITIMTPRDQYAIVKGGVYRFEVAGETSSNVRVTKGLAVVSGSSVSNNMSATAINDVVKLAPTEKSAADKFDDWSRERSDALIEANKALRKADWFKQLKKDRAYNEVQASDGVVEASIRHTVSARNGYVAFVERGEVLDAGESTWQDLKAGANLSSGARVRTAAACRAQLQPYPGVDLYLGSDTEIIYLEKEGHVSITLIKGSVIAITQLEKKNREPGLFMLRAQSIEYEPSAQGRFRLNLIENDFELKVFEGSIKVGIKVVKAPKRIVPTGTDQTIMDLNEKAIDSFDVWSTRRSLLPALASFKKITAPIGGLWLFIQGTGEYTFVPARREYKSPYGGLYLTTYMLPDDYRYRFIPAVGGPFKIPF